MKKISFLVVSIFLAITLISCYPRYTIIPLPDIDNPIDTDEPTPEPEVKRLARWKKEPKERPGYYIDKETYHEGINPVTGYKYRYYTMIPIHRRI